MVDDDKKVLFVEWCAADALGGMMQLSPMTELAYRRILDMIYSTEDNLVDDDEVLQYSTKTGAKWKTIKHELIEVHKKIYVENGFIRNKKCTEKLVKVGRILGQKSKAGKISAEKRKASKIKDQGLSEKNLEKIHEKNSPSEALKNPVDKISNALINNNTASTAVEVVLPKNANTTATNQEPRTKKEINTHTSATPDRVRGVWDFSDFWKARPGRGNATDSEDDAKREYRKLTDTGTATDQQLVDAMIAYAAQCRGDGKAGTRYAKSAGNFLRDGTWRQYAGLQEAPENADKPIARPPLNDVQKRIVATEDIGDTALHSWFKNARLVDGVLLVKTKFQRDWLRSHYEKLIAKAFGPSTKIEIEGGKA